MKSLQSPVTLLLILVVFLFLSLTVSVLINMKLLKEQENHTFYLKKESRLYNLAFKDTLTGLFNRNAYIRDLRKLQRKKPKSLCFSIFDIDDFKKINDAKGHLFGDEILVLAAKRLQNIFDTKEHIVYRLGGDEFFVISKNISEADLIALFLKLRNEEIKNGDFRFSKGYSFVAKNTALYFNIAFENADEMLYADKKAKNNTYSGKKTS